jgi:dTDP-4-amino-4,6-dideoxygalactose transaminase
MVDTTEIQEFCNDNNILFIEDAAQSLGSSLNGIKAGTIGDCSVISFNSNKVIAGINGGGVVLTDNDYVAKRIKMIRRHGKDKDFAILGFNSRMYVFNAQIINLRMKKMEQNQSIRQSIAKRYNEAFKDLPVYVQSPIQGLNHNFHKYTIRFHDKETRKRIKTALNASIHYETPLSENNMYSNIKFRKDNCTNSKLVSNTILSLPIHAWLTNEEIQTIINSVRNEL